MLLDERSNSASAREPGPADRPRGQRHGTGRPPTGAPIYHCYRYDRSAHGLPRDAEGTVLLDLPAAARDWSRHPWCQYETHLVPVAEIATAWLGEQLRAAAGALPAAGPDAALRLEAQWQSCTEALFSLASACHTSVTVPGGTRLAWAIVAVWDPTATHPLLRGDASGSQRGTL